MNKKSLIVYYTLFGNTAVVADEIARQTHFEIQKINELQMRDKSKIMPAATSAFLGLKSKIAKMNYELNEYDTIFLGAQVWAGKSTPAINRYLSKVNFKDKKIFLFMTKADDKVPEKVIDSIQNRIHKKGGQLVDVITFTSTLNLENPTVICIDDIKEELTTWLTKNKVLTSPDNLESNL